MADFDGVIDPDAGWPDVPQLSVDAVALGGHTGAMNAQAVALAARTKEIIRRLGNYEVPEYGAGMVAYRRNIQGAFAESVGKTLGREFIHVKSFGAIGDGTIHTVQEWIDAGVFSNLAAVQAIFPHVTAASDAIDWVAIKAAVEGAPKGSVVYFDPGQYVSNYRNHNAQANWVNIAKDGVTLLASPGSVSVKNICFYVVGATGPVGMIGENSFGIGSDEVNTEAPHGLIAGDYFQILSGINSHTTDAGEFQLGGPAVPSGTVPTCRFSEIHRVAAVVSDTVVRISGAVTYPGYKNNTIGQAYPIAGVTGAEWRKLSPVKNITFDGLGFESDAALFRQVFYRYAANLTFRNCRFDYGMNGGHAVVGNHVDGLAFENCISNQDVQESSVAGWNLFKICGGSQNVSFRGCRFSGGDQVVDFTPGIFALIVDERAALKCNSVTYQHVDVSHNRMERCNNGFTTHPGGYGLRAIGNDIDAYGPGSGILARSLSNIIASNQIRTPLNGIMLGGFCGWSSVYGNDIQDTGESGSFNGVFYSPSAAEQTNTNSVKGVKIFSNRIICRNITPNAFAFRARHYNNDPTPFLSTAQLIAKSDIRFYDNDCVGCGVFLAAFINGAEVYGNRFRGGAASDRYITSFSSAAPVLYDNVFEDDLAVAQYLVKQGNAIFTYDTSPILGPVYGVDSVPVCTYIGSTRQRPSDSTASSGVWTPTLTNGANAASSTAHPCQYIRVGNIVSFSGSVLINSTAAGDTVVTVSLPFAADFTATTDASGTLTSRASGPFGLIEASTALDGLSVMFRAAAAGSVIFKFSGSYKLN